MSLARQLYEATYEADAKARAEANKIWDSIVAYTEKLGSKGVRDLPRHPQMKGFVVTSDHTKLPRKVHVILAPKGAPTGIGKTVRFGRTAIIIGGILLRPFSTEYIDTRVESGRGSFVHEYTHYLDQQRYGAGVDPSVSRRAAQTQDWERYFRTPEEFNAWYQEAAHLVQADVESALRVIKQKGNPRVTEIFFGKLNKNFSTFSAFLGYAQTKGRTAEAVNAFKGSKWERKWLKRMHGLYRGLKVIVKGVQ